MREGTSSPFFIFCQQEGCLDTGGLLASKGPRPAFRSTRPADLIKPAKMDGPRKGRPFFDRTPPESGLLFLPNLYQIRVDVRGAADPLSRVGLPTSDVMIYLTPDVESTPNFENHAWIGSQISRSASSTPSNLRCGIKDTFAFMISKKRPRRKGPPLCSSVVFPAEPGQSVLQQFPCQKPQFEFLQRDLLLIQQLHTGLQALPVPAEGRSGHPADGLLVAGHDPVVVRA